jgi:lipopolysaccharide export system permease protein
LLRADQAIQEQRARTFVTLFDRHLLKRFWHVFAIGFVATYGLYVVFDAFSNADEFQSGAGEETTATVLRKMATHYFFQAFPFFDMVGPVLTVLAVVGVFALLQRSREFPPGGLRFRSSSEH